MVLTQDIILYYLIRKKIACLNKCGATLKLHQNDFCQRVLSCKINAISGSSMEIY